MPDIKLKGWSGHEWEHKDVPFVWLNDADGTGKLPFTYGEAVSKTVEPDFSGGDMSVPINEGELVTELTVKQPEDLVPENIPKGMYIAGVGPGEFEGGGNSESVASILNGTITEIDVPEVEIGQYAFYNHLNLKTARIKSAQKNAFHNCKTLTNVEIVDGTVLAGQTFYNCTGLAEVKAPKLEQIGNDFYGCTALTKIDMPNFILIGDSGFSGCTSLTELVSTAPVNYISVGRYGLLGCTSLKKIDIASTINFGRYSECKGCTALEAVIMRKTSGVVYDLMYAMSHASSTFYNCPNVYFYVPSVMIDTYLAKTNWATYASKFRAIEDYPDICD